MFVMLKCFVNSFAVSCSNIIARITSPLGAVYISRASQGYQKSLLVHIKTTQPKTAIPFFFISPEYFYSDSKMQIKRVSLVKRTSLAYI